MDEPFRVTVEPGGVVRVAGELDLATAGELAAALQPLDSVTIDCSELTFLDSAGIKVLVLAHRRAGESGGRFSMIGLGGAPLRVVQISGLETLLDNVSGDDTTGTPAVALSELGDEEEPAA